MRTSYSAAMNAAETVSMIDALIGLLVVVALALCIAHFAQPSSLHLDHPACQAGSSTAWSNG
jgi:hypothetical protein